VLESGNWALVYNDSPIGRNTMALSLSDDEGKSWRWTRHIGVGKPHEYFCMIQGADERIHITYSYTDDDGRTIRHSIVDEAWVKAGD
jgi:hypothetical protein